MLARNSVRSAFAARPTQVVARRGLHATPARMGGYHYPEGPRSSIPFNPNTRFFAVRFISYCGVGFGLPFLIAIWQLKKNQ